MEKFLDCENCKCRKGLVDKLVAQCTEDVKKAKIAVITLAEDKAKSNSWTLDIALFSIIFAINIGNGTHFIYCKHMNYN